MDEILRLLGHTGRYQILLWILLFFNYPQVPFNHLAMAFFGAQPLAYRCGNENIALGNTSIYGDYDEENNETCLMFGASQTDIANWCTVRPNCTTCNNSTPIVMEDREWTIVAQFDLVCGRQYLNNLASTIYFLGVLVGSLFFGYFADAYGRLPVLIVTLYLPTCVGIGLFFANSYVVFVILRFIVGFCMQGLQITLLALAMEFCTCDIRGIVGTALEVFWGFGVLLLGLLAFLLRDWRWMQLFISTSTLITLFYVWLFPESLRWLLAKGKYEKAKKLVEKISRYNGQKDVPKEVWDLLDKYEKQKDVSNTYNVFDLLRNKTLRKRSLIIWYIWFSAYMGYYGLIVDTSSLPGFKYTIFLIGSGAEMLAYFLDVPILHYVGRRLPLAWYLGVGGIACIVSTFIDAGNAQIALALVGRFGMSGADSIMFLYTAEMFPTTMRTVALGSGRFWTRVSGMLAPQLYLLATLSYSFIPMVVFGVLAIVAAFLALSLPETLNRKLPDTVAEAEALGWACCGDVHRQSNNETDINVNEKQENTKL